VIRNGKSFIISGLSNFYKEEAMEYNAHLRQLYSGGTKRVELVKPDAIDNQLFPFTVDYQRWLEEWEGPELELNGPSKRVKIQVKEAKE